MASYQTLVARLIPALHRCRAVTLLVLAVTLGPSGACAVGAEPASFDQAARAYLERIDRDPPSGDIDQDFAALLRPQHLTGVELSSVAIDHCRDTSLRAIAADILAHADRNRPVSNEAPPLAAQDPRRGEVIRALNIADGQARTAFAQPIDGDLDRQFAQLMGAHHQRVIDYATPS